MLNMGRIGPPHASDPETIREAIRERQLQEAQRLGWPQLDRADLTFGPLSGMVEHGPSGRRYRLRRGEADDLLYSSATAYFLDDGGALRFLEDAPRQRPTRTVEPAPRSRRLVKRPR
jgi:hypothetical protein